MEDLIKLASKHIKNGVHMSSLDDEEVKKMMKKIAANAVCIGLYNFSRLLISNIGDGEFKISKPDWIKAKDDLYRCLSIVDKEDENLKDILTSEEIEEAVKYTIFEGIGESAEDE